MLDHHKTVSFEIFEFMIHIYDLTKQATTISTFQNSEIVLKLFPISSTSKISIFINEIISGCTNKIDSMSTIKPLFKLRTIMKIVGIFQKLFEKQTQFGNKQEFGLFLLKVETYFSRNHVFWVEFAPVYKFIFFINLGRNKKKGKHFQLS